MKLYKWHTLIIKYGNAGVVTHELGFYTCECPTRTPILHVLRWNPKLKLRTVLSQNFRTTFTHYLTTCNQNLPHRRSQPPFNAFEREVFWEQMTTTFRGNVMDLPFHWIRLSHDAEYHNASLVRHRPIMSRHAKRFLLWSTYFAYTFLITLPYWIKRNFAVRWSLCQVCWKLLYLSKLKQIVLPCHLLNWTRTILKYRGAIICFEVF